MKLIKPSFEILSQQPEEIGMLKHIETCGRVAWKSEDKITENSYIKFVDMLKGVNHGSVLEHGTVYLSYRIDYNSNPSSNGYSQELEWKIKNFISKYTNDKYSKVIRYKVHYANFIAVTTNYRVIIENNWLDDLKYQCEPTEFHEKRVTVKFVCTIGVSREFNRHRVHSITEQSTRYCNYSKHKFNNEVTFIIPEWYNYLEEGSYTRANSIGWVNSKYLSTVKPIYGFPYVDNKYWDNPNQDWNLKADYKFIEVCKKEIKKYNVTSYMYTPLNYYLESLYDSERNYFSLLENGWKPQQAREVLPLNTSTELIHTAFVSDWKHFFKLRCDKSAHPQAQELAIPLQERFKELSLI